MTSLFSKYFPKILLIFLIISGAFFILIKLKPSNNQPEKNKNTLEKTGKDSLKNGDLIFQTSLSSQSQAIQLATKSKYSHCGIIYKQGNDYFVFEAIQPVSKTPLNEWIKRGQNGHYVVKRLKNADEILTPNIISKMKQVGEEFNSKNYDLYFDWSDDKIYCSELIWKIYQRATGIEIGRLQTLGEFDLTSKIVKQKMQERYGNSINLNEKVISPACIFESNLLTFIKSN